MDNYDVKKRDNPRILLFLWISLIATVILLLGLARQQLIVKDTYADMERRQTERRILLPAPRGDIYDRNSNLLVGNRPQYSATVILDDLRPEFRKEYSKLIKEARAQIKQRFEAKEDKAPHESLPLPDYSQLSWEARINVIQRYLDVINSVTLRKDTLNVSKIIRHYNEQLLLPLPLAEDLNVYEYAQLIEAIPVQSPIAIHTNTARHYPYKSLAAHTLGYVQNVNPDLSKLSNDGIKNFTFKTKLGKTGLEKTFDDYLAGTDGFEIWRVDPLGFQNKRLELNPPKQGNSLITSLDVDLQIAAETALGDRMGVVLAMDIKTGEMLSLASNPSYNLNDLSPFIPQATFDEINDAGAWLNRAVQLSYPPGSSFKLITAIAGLREGVIDASTKINCTGAYRVGNRIFHCNNRSGHGAVDIETAIAKSCNVFFYEVGLEIGIQKISEEAKRFRLDQKTGIELPFETSRLVVPDKAWKKKKMGESWWPGDTANTAIGQGFLLVTPLQMLTTIASIARDETRTDPTLKAIVKDQQNSQIQKHSPINLTTEQRTLLDQGMKACVSPMGTGKLAQIKDFNISGKTGTADFRAHGSDVNLAWFVGYAPSEDPKVAVVVMVQGKKKSDPYYGGSTAGPVAKDIFLTYKRKYLTP